MYTTHGHQIMGTPVEGDRPPVARCGGPSLCQDCAREATQATGGTLSYDVGRTVLEEGPLMAKARQITFDYIKARLEKTDTHVTFGIDEVYIVWFCKTLQHWKALLSTSLPDGMYYEVTYNGDQDEAYIDAYKKFDNVKVGGLG